MPSRVPAEYGVRFAGKKDDDEDGPDTKKRYAAPPAKLPDKKKRKWVKLLAYPALVLSLFGLGGAMASGQSTAPNAPVGVTQVLGGMMQSASLWLGIGLAFETILTVAVARRRRKQNEIYASGKIQKALEATGSSKAVSSENVTSVETLRNLLTPGKALSKTQEADLIESLETFNDFYVNSEDAPGAISDSTRERYITVVETLRARDVKKMAHVYAELGLRHPSQAIQALAKEFLGEHAKELLLSDSAKIAENDTLNRQFAASYVQTVLEGKQVAGQAISISESQVFDVSTAKTLLEAKDLDTEQLLEALQLVETGLAESQMRALVSLYAQMSIKHPSQDVKDHCKAFGKFSALSTSGDVNPAETARQARLVERKVSEAADEITTALSNAVQSNPVVKKFFEKELAGIEISSKLIIAEVKKNLTAQGVDLKDLTAVEQSEAVLAELRQTLDKGNFLDYIVPENIVNTARFKPDLTGDEELDTLRAGEMDLKKKLFKDSRVYVSFVLRYQAALAEQQKSEQNVIALEESLLALAKQKTDGKLKDTEELDNQILMKNDELKLAEKSVARAKVNAEKIGILMVQANGFVRNRTIQAQELIANLQDAVSRKKLTSNNEDYLKLIEQDGLEYDQNLKDLIEDIRQQGALKSVLADPNAFKLPDAEAAPDLAELLAAEEAQKKQVEEVKTKTHERNK